MIEKNALDGLKAALARPVAEPPVDPSLKPAAVLLLLTSGGEGPAVAFTQRTSRVEHHKGEVSFPGGACDPEDKDALATALRETSEEIGVPSQQVQVLGQLPRTATRSNFTIVPFVGALTGLYRFSPNPNEVAEVFTVPVCWLLDPANRREEPQLRDGQVITAFAYYYQGHRIWGATARILTSFLDLVAELAKKEHVWTALSAISRR